MKKTIGIIGGDLRNIRLSEILTNDGYTVYTYGLEKNDFKCKNIIKCNTIKEINNNCSNIISGIPFSRDGQYINAPFSNRSILITEVFSQMFGKTLIAGAIKTNITEQAKKENIEIIDLMDNESLTILNVIPTVEGAIQIAMEQTEFTIHDSNFLVLGFGRIGKYLSRALKELGANVSCMARKDKDLAWIKTLKYDGIHINELTQNLDKFDIIFNTIPALILDSERLEMLRDNDRIVIIDLASKPGGVDFEKAREYNIKTIQALGLPGKVAPFTSAQYIKRTIDEILNTRKKE